MDYNVHANIGANEWVAANNASGVANTDLVLTKVAVAGQTTKLAGFSVSYSPVGAGATVQVEDGAGNIVWGPFAIPDTINVNVFDFGGVPMAGTVNTAMIITAHAAGAAAVAHIAANWWTDAGPSRTT